MTGQKRGTVGTDLGIVGIVSTPKTVARQLESVENLKRQTNEFFFLSGLKLTSIEKKNGYTNNKKKVTAQRSKRHYTRMRSLNTQEEGLDREKTNLRKKGN